MADTVTVLFIPIGKFKVPVFEEVTRDLISALVYSGIDLGVGPGLVGWEGKHRALEHPLRHGFFILPKDF
jgi:hypothetical protein